MPAQPLSREQRLDADRLKAIYASKKRSLSLTQESLAAACGWESQGTVSQYLNGKIPLNKDAAVKFARHLKVKVEEFSPQLARDLAELLKPGSSSTPVDGDNAVPSEQAGPPLGPALAELVESARPLSDADVRLLAQIATRLRGDHDLPPVESSAFLPSVPATPKARA